MFYIRKATTADIPLINNLAKQVFPETYKNILSQEQIDFMMDWMYSPESLRKQMEEEGHTYYIAYEECEAAGYVSNRSTKTCLSCRRSMCCHITRNTVWADNSLNRP